MRCGGHVFGVEVSDTEHGLGLVASTDLKGGEVLLALPAKKVLSYENVQCTALGQIILDQICRSESVDVHPEGSTLTGLSTAQKECVVVTALLAMRGRQTESSSLLIDIPDWGPYVDILPPSQNTALTAQSSIQSALLSSTPLLPSLQSLLLQLRKQHSLLFPALSDRHPNLFPSPCCSFTDFLWAYSSFHSRCFPISVTTPGASVGDLGLPVFESTGLEECLLPVIDIANHRRGQSMRLAAES